MIRWLLHLLILIHIYFFPLLFPIQIYWLHWFLLPLHLFISTYTLRFVLLFLSCKFSQIQCQPVFLLFRLWPLLMSLNVAPLLPPILMPHRIPRYIRLLLILRHRTTLLTRIIYLPRSSILIDYISMFSRPLRPKIQLRFLLLIPHQHFLIPQLTRSIWRFITFPQHSNIYQ